MASPYLSFVAASRNDDHGGRLLERMQIFIDALAGQCATHQLSAELVLVEWNPPGDRPPLGEALRWPAIDQLSIRLITVGAEEHGRFAHSSQLPFFQMIAKNVGIRRAKGKFVLATNVDVLFSDELVAFLGSGKLQPERMYRIDRYDVDEDVPVDAKTIEQLAYCKAHVIRVNSRMATVDLRTGERHGAPSTWLVPLRVAVLVRKKLGQGYMDKLRRFVPSYLLRRVPPVLDLHTNACGDFTLLSRESWAEVRGYPELEMFSMHLDSLLCYIAHYSGMTETVLEEPMRIYHIEHHSGWSPEVEKSQVLDRRLDSAGVPRLSDDELARWAREMYDTGIPKSFNDDDWGMREADLPEARLA